MEVTFEQRLTGGRRGTPVGKCSSGRVLSRRDKLGMFG